MWVGRNDSRLLVNEDETAWGMERRAICDQEIGGYTIPRGAAVLMPTYVTNRDPRRFPDPLRFDPARFLPEANADRPDWAYPLERRSAIWVALERRESADD